VCILLCLPRELLHLDQMESKQEYKERWLTSPWDHSFERPVEVVLLDVVFTLDMDARYQSDWK
jgi:hypothetical protein